MAIKGNKETNSYYTQEYSQFVGVDFTNPVTEVAANRSPDCINMIAGDSQFPQKRTGYEIINTFDSRINGIFKFIDSNNVKRMVVHSGNKLYSFIETSPVIQPNPPQAYIYVVVLPQNAVPTVIYEGMNNSRSTSFVMNNKLYVIDGSKYVVYDGNTCTDVEGHIPTTVISASPNGGGDDYEPINLLSTQRINSFLGTATAVTYQLDATNITSVDKVEKLNANGTWDIVTNYTVNTASGEITFTSAPGESVITGDDNIKVTFSKNVASNRSKICNCRIYAYYGLNNDKRIFLSGNPNYKNYDWYSWTNDPTYFPETYYNVVGADNSAIMGYLKQYDSLIIIKQRNDQEATIYIRKATENNNGDLVFTTQNGLSGMGAVSMYAFNTLYDDNVFLSENGVFGLDTSSVTLQRTTQLRSLFVNGKLLNEQNLEEAVACIWKSFYCLFINGHVYLADARQRSSNGSGSSGYEWYYWDNVPARTAAEYEGQLYFGDNVGNLYVFKTEKEYGMEAYSDNGEAIDAYWTTKYDDLGDCSSFKKIAKRNVGLVMMPFGKTSGKIYYAGSEEKLIKTYSLSVNFDFDDVDFDEFNFGKLPIPTYIPCNKKEKNVGMFRMKIQNNKINEAFGIFKIHLKFEYKKPIKK